MKSLVVDTLQYGDYSLIISINGTIDLALDGNDGDDTTPDGNEAHHHDDSMLDISSIEVLGLFHSTSIVTKHEFC